jgi:flagellar biosynthesis protein FliP
MMKVLAIIPLVFFAQADGLVQGWPNIILQGGAFSLLVFIIWWLLTKHIPEQQKTFFDALTSQQKTFADALNKLTADSAADRDVFRAEIQAHEIAQRAKDERMIELLSKRP